MNPILQATLIKTGTVLVEKLSAVGSAKLAELLEPLTTTATLEEILESKTGQEAVNIAVDYIKRENGLPNSSILKILKALITNAWKLSKEDALQADLNIEFARKISQLEANELLVLITAHRISKKPEFLSTIYTGNIAGWVKQLERETGFGYPEIIQEAVEGLANKKLVHEISSFHESHSFSPDVGQKNRNNLTGLGYAIVDSVYPELKEYLDGLGREEEMISS